MFFVSGEVQYLEIATSFPLLDTIEQDIKIA